MIELELTRICASTFMPLGKVYMVGKRFKVWTADEKRGKVEREVTYVDGVPVDERYVDVVDLIQKHIYTKTITKKINYRNPIADLGYGDPFVESEE